LRHSSARISEKVTLTFFITHEPKPASRGYPAAHHIVIAGTETAMPVIEELYRLFSMGSKHPVHGRITGVARVMDIQKALHQYSPRLS